MGSGKKLFVVSDFHGAHFLKNAIWKEMENADVIVFCGDGISGFLEMADAFADKIVAVGGNCDFCSGQSEKIFEAGGVFFLALHGHTFGVKGGEENLKKLALHAKEIGASVVFFGHTHVATAVEYFGVKLINPGAMYSGRPSFYAGEVRDGVFWGEHQEINW